MAYHDDGEEQFKPPAEPIDRIVGPFERFMHVEAAGGIVLLVATAIALVLANSPWSASYLEFWQTKVGFSIGSFETSHSLKHWVSDGLMALFFFVIGLEVKRELVVGELRDLRKAALPISAAIGGMVVPAALYLVFQSGGEAARGWGIPMATDIAFVVGCLAVLGKRVPVSLRVFLVSLAIVDDIGAILVIALGYTAHIDVDTLLLGVAGIAAVALLSRVGVRSMPVYVVMGLFIWQMFHVSGIHATIAGVILGLQTPAKTYLSTSFLSNYLHSAGDFLHGGGWEELSNRAVQVRRARWKLRESVPPVEYLETTLHPWTTFAVIPVFALANAAVPLELEAFGDPIALSVAIGLVVGKPVGILVFSWIAVKLGIARLPDEFGWSVVAAGGMLAGIGFTMSLFISGLALEGAALTTAKVGVLAGSAVAAVLGFVALARLLPKPAAG